MKKEFILEGKNPLANMMYIPVRKAAMHITYNSEDSLMQLMESDAILKGKFVHIEAVEKINLYPSKEIRVILSKLSGSAVKFMLWIMLRLDYGKDYVWLPPKKYMLYADISSANTYRKILKELVLSNVIYKSVEFKDVYWVNPNIMFKGSRVKKYNDKLTII